MLSNVKIGDTLICNRHLYKVERLTKEEIEAVQEKALHEMLVSKAWNFKKWYEVSLEDIKVIDEILKKYEVRR